MSEGLFLEDGFNGTTKSALPGDTRACDPDGPGARRRASVAVGRDRLDRRETGMHVDWFNHRRLLEPIGYLPPAEYEARYYQQIAVA